MTTLQEHAQPRDASTDAAATATAGSQGRAPDAAAVVRGMLSTGRRDPAAIGAVVKAHPDARAEIVALLHQAAGNRFVGLVFATLGEAPAGVEDPHGNEPAPVGNGFGGAGSEGVDFDPGTAPATPVAPVSTAAADSPFGYAHDSADSSLPPVTTPPKKQRPVVKQEKQFAEYATKPDVARTAPAPTLDVHKALDGTDVTAINTQAIEGTFLNEVRHAPQRFDAKALQIAQTALKVTNTSGAFNTETLRKLLAATKTTLSPPSKKAPKDPATVLPQLTVANVTDPTFWAAIYDEKADREYEENGVQVKGKLKLFMTDAATISPADKATWDPTAAAPADQVAHAMGGKSYREYVDSVLQPFTFLGFKPNGSKAHPDLVARLASAERFLVNFYKDKKDHNGNPITPDRIAKEIGWSGNLVTIYDPNPETAIPGVLLQKADPAKGIPEKRTPTTYGHIHFHNMGLAVDFDPARNPYIFDQSDPKEIRKSAVDTANYNEREASKKAHAADPSVEVVKADDQLDSVAAGNAAADYWDEMARAAYKQAADLYGGEALSGAAMMGWSKHLSTEELHAKVSQASKSMEQYLTDASAANKEGGTGPANTKILGLFAGAGYSPEKAKQGLEEMKKFEKSFWHSMSRDGTKAGTGTNRKTNAQGLELSVALRDAGGLMWGGTEMSGGDNGDFMHFDVRQDAVGKQFLAALKK